METARPSETSVTLPVDTASCLHQQGCDNHKYRTVYSACEQIRLLAVTFKEAAGCVMSRAGFGSSCMCANGETRDGQIKSAQP
jgi:hypothetical protein